MKTKKNPAAAPEDIALPESRDECALPEKPRMTLTTREGGVTIVNTEAAPTSEESENA